MSDLIPAGPEQLLPSATRVALADDAPSIEELFLFAREAELRVQSLRMTIEEQVVSARGAEHIVHEVQLRHPGHARVTTKRSSEPLSRDYDTWVSQGETITTFDARNRLASVRKHPRRLVGSDDPGLPPFARQYQPLTKLPAGSLADAFIHPHGLFRNVLVSGPLAIVGVQQVAGREAIVVRAQHPRSAKVLVDRPDRSVEVGIGRDSGFVLLLIERIGDAITRHAEVTTLQIDPVILDSAFELRLPDDVRKVY
ncbi:MAG TPA: hypothetical protein VK987_10160 [Anaerolineae bacterium]|jgi:hypothetical protein|nr:hypothetical protein [Anaerolineae bacterium]